MPNEKTAEGTKEERAIMKDLEKNKVKRKKYINMTFSGNGWKTNWINILNEMYNDGYKWLPPLMNIGNDASKNTNPPIIQAVFEDVTYTNEFQDYMGYRNEDETEEFRKKRATKKKYKSKRNSLNKK